jgi:predicted PurR-regulated permease PerM
MVIGLVVAISLFSNARLDLDDHPRARRSFYALLCDEIQKRFRAFYLSFELVLGAQLVISCINTVLTSIFLVAVQMPNAWIFVVITFLCGFLPIIGNLISNFLIVGMAFTVSPHLAVAAVVFLVVVHKLEYFLNSKIIGSRIKNPVWLTLLGLVVGERLMGVPGMILAPVVLHYIKVELSRIEMHSGPVKPRQLAEPETELAGGPSDT